jgi:DNA-binding beta-propeller fold protein YncE
VAIDPAAGKIYWANFYSNGIRVANLDGTGSASTLFDGGETRLCGVAIDPAAGKIYWANFNSNGIRVANLDGSGSASTLFGELGGSGPSGVSIDSAAGKIYWTNQNTDEVRVANLDGSGGVSTLFGPADAGDNPIGVAIDPAGGKIYWAALVSGQVRMGNLDGTGAATLFGGENGPGAVAIDPGAGKIYWANFRSGSIRVGNLDRSGTPATLFDFENTPLFPALLRAPEAGSQSPAISGGANLGDALSCSTGSWKPDLLGAFLFRAPRSFAYQWQLDGNDTPGATASSFTFTEAGDYTCRVTAFNHAGSASKTSDVFKVTLLGVEKFYDANANGQFDATDSTIAGWKVQVGSSSYLTPKSLKVDPGSYVVSEVSPVQTNWRHTNPGSVQASAVAGDETTVEFGNVCIGAGGSQGTGFWGNKNGQALFGADDLALMVNLNLRNADGSHFNPTSYSAFSNWLQKASGANMAYDLSAQLAAMELNVLNGKVGGGSLIYAPGTTSANAAGFATVNAVMTEANTELGLHGLTKSGPFRAYQTALRDALLNANGNTTFVRATPCPFSFG